jgi:hypothetical protein
MSTPFIEIPHRAAAFPAHHVLGDAGARIAVDRDLGLLVHARGVVADVSVDGHLDRCVDADGHVVRPVGMRDHELAREVRRVQCGVHLPQRSGSQIIRGHRGCHRFHA